MTALATRDGLPDDLLQLRKRYPRDTWPGHANLGEWVQFWLDRHRMFRELGAMLDEACEHLRGERITLDEFKPWFAPRLEFFFGHLDLHHKIEEFHLFPVFAKAEPVLQHGFTLLEADHQAIHALVDTMQGAAATLLADGIVEHDQVRRAGEDTGRELAALLRGLTAHLDDEEDLIVPIVLDHSESQLGLV
ncbi:MAG: hemerythrin domain-containing protein [Alphaproteobacteria bacterium]|nr:hemerythrin domain-containing protein [Alphaproteobacteria bacterium]